MKQRETLVLKYVLSGSYQDAKVAGVLIPIPKRNWREIPKQPQRENNKGKKKKKNCKKSLGDVCALKLLCEGNGRSKTFYKRENFFFHHHFVLPSPFCWDELSASQLWQFCFWNKCPQKYYQVSREGLCLSGIEMSNMGINELLAVASLIIQEVPSPYPLGITIGS